MHATDASRGFSELLSRAASGETIEIDRHGDVVAIIGPPRRSYVRGDALVQLLPRLPRPDADFAADVRALAEIAASPHDTWES